MTLQMLKTMHDDLANTLRLVHEGEPVVLEFEGKPIAAIISIQDLLILEQRIEELEDRIDLAEMAKAKAESEGAVPYEEVRKELAL